MKQRTAGIVLLLFLGGINFADRAVIGLAALPIRAELQLSTDEWGLVGSSFFFLFSLSSIVVPILPLRTQSLLGGMALLWSAAQLIAAFFQNLPFLIISRILLGVGEGPAYALSMFQAGKWTAPEHRGKVFAVLTLGSALGPALLSPVLGSLINWVGWRQTFAMLAGIGIIWWIAWQVWKPRRLETEESAEKKKKAETALLPLFRALCTPSTLLLVLAGVAAYWYLAVLITWVPTYFNTVGVSVGSPLYLWAISLPWLGAGVLQVVIGAVSDRIYSRRENSYARVLPLALSLIIGGGCLFLVGSNPATPLVTIICLSLTPVGATFPLIALLLQHRALQGIVVGLYSLAGILSPAVTGILITRAPTPAEGFSRAFFLAALILVVSGLLCTLFVRSIAPKQNISEPISLK